MSLLCDCTMFRRARLRAIHLELDLRCDAVLYLFALKVRYKKIKE